MKTTDAARGKWRTILLAFGIDATALNGKHHPCPCTGDGRDRFRFTDQNGRGSFFCACSQGDKDGFQLLACKTGREFKDLAAEVDTLIGNTRDADFVPRQSTYAEQLRAIAKASPRSAYLASRGLEVAPGLLWANGVECRDDGKTIGKFAAMLAPVTRKGEFLTFHVTYLHNGAKANVPCPRKVLPGGSITGAGVELYPAAEVMGVAEGIETAIAAKMLFDIPTHAAMNADMLAKWEAPAVAKTIHIFADHDTNYTGHRGAWSLANRLALKGITPIVHIPKSIGDFNDVLLAKRKAA